MTLDYSVSRDATPLWKATQVVVATSLETHKSIPWPVDMLAALQSFREASADV